MCTCLQLTSVSSHSARFSARCRARFCNDIRNSCLCFAATKMPVFSTRADTRLTNVLLLDGTHPSPCEKVVITLAASVHLSVCLSRLFPSLNRARGRILNVSNQEHHARFIQQMSHAVQQPRCWAFVELLSLNNWLHYKALSSTFYKLFFVEKKQSKADFLSNCAVRHSFFTVRVRFEKVCKF